MYFSVLILESSNFSKNNITFVYILEVIIELNSGQWFGWQLNNKLILGALEIKR